MVEGLVIEESGSHHGRQEAKEGGTKEGDIVFQATPLVTDLFWFCPTYYQKSAASPHDSITFQKQCLWIHENFEAHSWFQPQQYHCTFLVYFLLYRNEQFYYPKILSDKSHYDNNLFYKAIYTQISVLLIQLLYFSFISLCRIQPLFQTMHRLIVV